MSRISVSGGTGYAGGAVVDEAVARGHQVTSFSRHEAVNKIDGVDYVIGSVLDPEVLEVSVTGHDVVIEAVSPRGWFYVSPPASFGAWAPAPDTGSYRLSKDVLLKDDAGNSSISAADLARAILDEIEKPQFHHRRFHAAH